MYKFGNNNFEFFGSSIRVKGNLEIDCVDGDVIFKGKNFDFGKGMLKGDNLSVAGGGVKRGKEGSLLGSIPKYSGTGGETIESSGIVIDSNDNLIIPGDIVIDESVTIRNIDSSIKRTLNLPKLSGCVGLCQYDVISTSNIVTSSINKTYTTTHLFIYKGSKYTAVLSKVKCVIDTKGNDVNIRLYDITNRKIICEKLSVNNSDKTVLDLGTIDNVPEEESILETQICNPSIIGKKNVVLYTTCIYFA